MLPELLIRHLVDWCAQEQLPICEPMVADGIVSIKLPAELKIYILFYEDSLSCYLRHCGGQPVIMKWPYSVPNFPEQLENYLLQVRDAAASGQIVPLLESHAR